MKRLLFSTYSSLSNPSPELEEDLLVLEDVGNENPVAIIVYNDDHNTFDWVIKSFQDVLSHTSAQAEQLAIIIHTKGKATVKSGPRNQLKPQKDALVDRGLSAVIEDIE